MNAVIHMLQLQATTFKTFHMEIPKPPAYISPIHLPDGFHYLNLDHSNEGNILTHLLQYNSQ